MKRLTDLQQKAVEAAKEILKDKPWFRGVCLDNLPTDKEIEQNFDGAVASIVFETEYWDNPDVI